MQRSPFQPTTLPSLTTQYRHTMRRRRLLTPCYCAAGSAMTAARERCSSCFLGHEYSVAPRSIFSDRRRQIYRGFDTRWRRIQLSCANENEQEQHLSKAIYSPFSAQTRTYQDESPLSARRRCSSCGHGEHSHFNSRFMCIRRSHEDDAAVFNIALQAREVTPTGHANISSRQDTQKWSLDEPASLLSIDCVVCFTKFVSAVSIRPALGDVPECTVVSLLSATSLGLLFTRLLRRVNKEIRDTVTPVTPTHLSCLPHLNERGILLAHGHSFKDTTSKIVASSIENGRGQFESSE